MENHNQTIIDKWLITISDKLNWYLKVLTFTELIPIFKDESVSTEHIFLTLYNKGLIGSHVSNIQFMKENLQIGIPQNFNNVRFFITEKGTNLIKTIKEQGEVKEEEQTQIIFPD